MTHNINDKTKLKASKLLDFMAQWAEEAEGWEFKDQLKSLETLEEVFINSDAADDPSTRRLVYFHLSFYKQLVTKLAKQKTETFQAMSQITHQLIQPEA